MRFLYRLVCWIRGYHAWIFDDEETTTAGQPTYRCLSCEKTTITLTQDC